MASGRAICLGRGKYSQGSFMRLTYNAMKYESGGVDAAQMSPPMFRQWNIDLSHLFSHCGGASKLHHHPYHPAKY